MIEVKSLRDGRVGIAPVDDSALSGRMNPVVLREAVLMYEANRRVGSACTKTRSQVNGSTKKTYRQKGTGRARHGDRKSPVFRGGGVAHGPKPRDFSYALPRKALRRALRVALAGKLRDGEIVRWEGGPSLSAPSAKTVRTALQALDIHTSALLVSSGAAGRNLLLSVRNLPRVQVLPAAEVSAYDLVSHKWLVLLDGAWDVLQARLDAAQTTPEADVDAEGSAS